MVESHKENWKTTRAYYARAIFFFANLIKRIESNYIHSKNRKYNQVNLIKRIESTMPKPSKTKQTQENLIKRIESWTQNHYTYSNRYWIKNLIKRIESAWGHAGGPVCGHMESHKENWKIINRLAASNLFSRESHKENWKSRQYLVQSSSILRIS